MLEKLSVDYGMTVGTVDAKWQSLKDFWSAAYQNQINGGLKGTGSSEPAYQTPAVYALMSGWLVERNDAWKTAALDQLSYSKNNRYLSGYPYVPASPQLIYRDKVAREAIAQYHASDIFGDANVRAGVSTLVGKMLALPRAVVSINVNGASQSKDLMYSAYNSDLTPNINPGCLTCESVSPNQNAEVGLIYTLVYHDPRFPEYHTQQVRDLALGELYAAISMQKPNGELPTATGSPCYYDTNYGALAFQLLSMANVYWKNADFSAAISKGGQWLSNYEGDGNWAYHIANGGTCGTRLTLANEACGAPPQGYPTILGTPPNYCETGQEMWNRVPALRAFNGTVIKNKATYYSNMFNSSRWLNEIVYDGRIVFFMNSGIPFSDYFPGAN